MNVSYSMQRLWLLGKLVGYRRMEQNNWFYSVDEFWWNGKPIEFDRIDPSAACQDKNRRNLFQNDIVYAYKGKNGRFVNLVCRDGKCFGRTFVGDELLDLSTCRLEFKAIGSGNRNMDRILIEHISNTKGLKDQLKPIS